METGVVFRAPPLVVAVGAGAVVVKGGARRDRVRTGCGVAALADTVG